MNQLSFRRYEIRSELGRGGTGTVYEAYDSKTHTTVALKTIDGGAAENLYRLKQEFRALTDVQHKNLVRFGELSCEEGQWFFTMELVRGTNFIDHVRPLERAYDEPTGASTAWKSTIIKLCDPESEVIPVASAEESIEGGPKLDEARLRSALPQLVSAICAIHDAGRVHRDVKPSNVLVAKDGRVVLLDFGLVMSIARRVAAMADDTEATDTELLGTPAYMAPEQVEGLVVGPPADWYAVGIMLFSALTGTLPFKGSVGALLRARVSQAAPSPRDLAPDAPQDLVDLCVDLLKTRPEQRPRAPKFSRASG